VRSTAWYRNVASHDVFDDRPVGLPHFYRCSFYPKVQAKPPWWTVACTPAMDVNEAAEWVCEDAAVIPDCQFGPNASTEIGHL
jgi:hypothetical protein